MVEEKEFLFRMFENSIQKESKELDTWAINRERKFLRLKTYDVEIKKDIPYLNDGNPRHTLDIISPKFHTKPLPVIINIHGGGLLMGRKEQNTGMNMYLSSHGFIVYSIEYSLVPEVKVQDQLSEINAALFYIKDRVKTDGGDVNRICMVGDSAGAFLAMYCAAMQKNKDIADAFGVRAPGIDVKAIAFQSGMFYTMGFNKIGIFLSKTLYGRDYKNQAFAKYLNPECQEVINYLPPVYLITGYKDNMRRSIDMYKAALDKLGVEYSYEFCYEMSHAECALYPERALSEYINEKMISYFSKYIED